MHLILPYSLKQTKQKNPKQMAGLTFLVSYFFCLCICFINITHNDRQGFSSLLVDWMTRVTLSQKFLYNFFFHLKLSQILKSLQSLVIIKCGFIMYLGFLFEFFVKQYSHPWWPPVHELTSHNVLMVALLVFR